MRILHVTPYSYGAWAYGGIPRLSFHLAEAQARLGHQVDVVTTDVRDEKSRRPPGKDRVEGVNLRVYRNLSNITAYHFQFFTPVGLSAEKKLIKDYDLVHIHGHRNLLCTRMALMAADAGVPVVLQPNGTLVNIERRILLKKLYDLALGKRQLARTSAFIAVSEAEKKQFLEMDIPEEKVRVIPNGVALDPDPPDPEFKKRRGLPEAYLLYLGKLTPRKGIEHAVSALPLLEDRSLSLVIAGNDMGYRRHLERLIRKLKLEDRVVFTGLLEGSEKTAAYGDALYTVYAGRDEIFGLVPWESILCGTPVIVASDSGCGEWIAKAKAGHVVPYGDPAAIAKVVNEKNEEQDRAMVRAGQEFCRSRLSWDRIAKETIEYYQEIIEQS